MRKYIFLTISLGWLITMPSMAQLGRVWQDFKSYSGDLQTYLRNNLRETLKPVEIQSRNALNQSTGELNLPDPIVAGTLVSNDMIVNSMSDKFDNNSALYSTSVSNEINRLITRGSAVGILGKNGQILSKVKLENTEKGLNNIDAFSKAADENTQNFLDDIQQKVSQLNGANNIPIVSTLLSAANQATLQLQEIKIQREQSKILAETFAQTMQTNQFLQYSNLNLANLSQQIEETNRVRRVDTSVEAARLLRTTAQTDLLGRKIDK